MAVTTSDLLARVETDLDEETLQRILDAAVKSVDRSAGSVSSAVETHRAFGVRQIVLSRRHDSITSITERRSDDADAVALSANDYRESGGYRLLRLPAGDNPASSWGVEVVVEYVPEVDTEVRDRVALDLALMDIEFRAFDREESDDWEGEQRDYKARRRELLRQVREGRSLIA